jgi:dTDP-D-glucose 4,6-dehydratase
MQSVFATKPKPSPGISSETDGDYDSDRCDFICIAERIAGKGSIVKVLPEIYPDTFNLESFLQQITSQDTPFQDTQSIISFTNTQSYVSKRTSINPQKIKQKTSNLTQIRFHSYFRFTVSHFLI